MSERRPRWEWHPAIRAILWIANWLFFAACTSVVVEFLATTREELFTAPLRLVARWVVIVAGMALAVPLWGAVEIWWTLAQHARRNYEPRFARRLMLVEGAVIGVCAAVYATPAFLFLRWLWRVLERWSRGLTIALPARDGAGWVATLVLIAIGAVLALWTTVSVYFMVRNYADCLRVLGMRHVLRGVAMMLLLRARQPRRDFFMQVPVVGDMFPLAIAALAYTFIPSPLLAAAIASMIVVGHLSVSLDRIRPPTWVFLGGSNYEAFAAFRRLRMAWGVTAVTLLDRSNEGGRAFYDAERSHWSRSGALPRGLFYSPTVPRMWSLRTRPDHWEHSVLVLIDYAPRVVVDVREMSEYVRAELVWLAQPGRIEKTWFLVDESGLTPELAAQIPAAAHGRALTEEALVRTAPG